MLGLRLWLWLWLHELLRHKFSEGLYGILLPCHEIEIVLEAFGKSTPKVDPITNPYGLVLPQPPIIEQTIRLLKSNGCNLFLEHEVYTSCVFLLFGVAEYAVSILKQLELLLEQLGNDSIVHEAGGSFVFLGSIGEYASLGRVPVQVE